MNAAIGSGLDAPVLRDPLHGIRMATLRLEQLQNLGNSSSDVFHAAVRTVHELCTLLQAAEQASMTTPTIREAAATAHRIHGESRFISRLQRWPRGYPGDFETIEMILGGARLPEAPRLSDALEYIALSSPAAQQHRNKVAAQRELLDATAESNGAACVLVMACGSAPDVRAARTLLRSADATIVLNDADAEALAFARAGLERARPLARVECVEGNALRGVRSFEKLGPFDLVMAGGLFDYLSDRQIEFVVSHAVRRLLKPGGTLFFTNIATGNPYRVWMEYCADWRLIERSEAEIRSLVAGSVDQPLEIEITRDATGLTHLVRVQLAG